MKTILLKSNNLNIGYVSKKKQTIVATNININLNKPKFISLIGENGIGKSTLLRTLSKVQPKLSGELFLDEINIDKLSFLSLAKKISIVLTEKVPSSNITVYELIALGRQPYSNWIGTLSEFDQLKIENAITLCNITNLKNRKIDELSDGQYQKVMIARSLAQNTNIILLDEPTAHLDINNKIEIFQLLKKLVQVEKKLIIISTHEMQLALHLSDELWIMTKDEFLIDTTKNHIDKGHLDKIVNSKYVSFDKLKKEFVYK